MTIQPEFVDDVLEDVDACTWSCQVHNTPISEPGEADPDSTLEKKNGSGRQENLYPDLTLENNPNPDPTSEYSPLTFFFNIKVHVIDILLFYSGQ